MKHLIFLCLFLSACDISNQSDKSPSALDIQTPKEVVEIEKENDVEENFRFNSDTVLRQQRHQAINKIPKERRTLRSGVENLMGLMHRCEKHTGKLKVRGLFNCKLYVFAMGISINFERIFRHLNAFFALFLVSYSVKRHSDDNALIIR